MKIDPQSASVLLEVALEGVTRAMTAYGAARAVAQEAGVTPEQLADADARFAKNYADPLAPAPAQPAP